MNTEELEQSLRAEFDGQIKDAISKIREEVNGLQKNYESEFEKHRSQMDEAFRLLSSKLDEPFAFDLAFTESVVEHLRLARDEGAMITATALGEAEKLGGDRSDQEFEKLRNAITEIKGNNTQGSILRALVDAAAEFAPRGAFFILKNDHLVGWKVFGTSEISDDDVRSIHFPVTDNTLVSNAIASLAVGMGSFSDQTDNAKFLGPLAFGAPNKMSAIPLIARERGVAVLYVDGGESEENVNLQALETLVSVAGLRVELLASEAYPAPVEPGPDFQEQVSEPAFESFEQPHIEEPSVEIEPEYVGVVEVAEDAVTEISDYDASPVLVEENVSEEGQFEQPVVEEPTFEESVVEESKFEEPAVEEPTFEESVVEESKFEEPAVEEPAFEESVVEESKFEEPAVEEPTFEESVVEESKFEEPAAEEFAVESNDQTTEFEFSNDFAIVDNGLSEEAVSNVDQKVEEFEAPAEEFAESAQKDYAPVEEFESHEVEVSTHEVEAAVEEAESDAAEPFVEESPVAEPEAVKSYRERNAELPIEVSDDERESHTKARRFARLLVSEIRLYNEQKVIDGREAGEIYEILREAIDRSREMYEKRVQPDVAAKFDYFHFELVNNLAEGEEVKLGASYFAVKV
ncbi:MAG: hypothetical protein ACRD6X_13330 [Pyrinomonadaceae bacterium]